MNIKRIDLQCINCNATVEINLSSLARNFHCWQGVKCPYCDEYNHLRMGLSEA